MNEKSKFEKKCKEKVKKKEKKKKVRDKLKPDIHTQLLNDHFKALFIFLQKKNTNFIIFLLFFTFQLVSSRVMLN